MSLAQKRQVLGYFPFISSPFNAFSVPPVYSSHSESDIHAIRVHYSDAASVFCGVRLLLIAFSSRNVLQQYLAAFCPTGG